VHGDVGARTTDGRRRHNARIARRGYLRAENPVQVANDLSGSLGAAHPMATLPKSRSVQPFVAGSYLLPRLALIADSGARQVQ